MEDVNKKRAEKLVVGSMREKGYFSNDRDN